MDATANDDLSTGTFPMRLLLTFLLLASTADAGVVLLPQSVQLDGPEATGRLLLQEGTKENIGRHVADGVTWTSADPAVVRVEEGRLTPVADGTAVVTATTADGQSASASVEVRDSGQPFDWNFRNHVLPVMAKQGCNMGACHGALAGKGGFRLSLRGYDPLRDYYTITREVRGRRVTPADPGRSLILTKPSGAVAHKGGLKLPQDSHGYRVLSEWISQGVKPPTEDDARLEALSVFPAVSTLTVGDAQPLVVTARYSDGREEDVTQWVKWSTADSSVADVDDATGVVTVTGSGEGAIIAWFSSQIVIARITSPFPTELPANAYADFAPRNFLDEQVLQQWRRLNIQPSPAVDDAAFLRRASLDTIGRLPSDEELTAFLADKSSEKREQLVERLLASDAFVDYWAYKWSDVFLINGTLLRPMAVEAYYKWVRGHVAENTPWDEVAREVVTAVGESTENGATNFYALHQTPEDMTENVSKAFLGLSIGCAKCHNHPLEKWTNDQYYAMASHFSRVRAKGWGGEVRNGDGVRTLFVTDEGELIQPTTGRPQPPTPLDGTPRDFDVPGDRREPLSQWLTGDENPYFAKAITNRVWQNFFGVGLVEEVDDLRVSNPASNEALLSEAADYLKSEDYDLKALMRVILNSETYRRSSEVLSANGDDHRFYSRYYPRRLPAEVLLDAVTDVTGVSETFNEISYPGDDHQKTEFYPEGTKATELYDSAVSSYFLTTFGRNAREITCECERSDEPSMVQVLHISNGTTVNGKLASETGRLNQWLADELSNDEVIRRIYRAALSREPSERELSGVLAVLEDAGETDRRVVLEDTFWAVLSSREFLFNH